MDTSAPPTKFATAIHITALDGIVNVNSLFTLAVFIGLSWNPADPTNGLIDPNNNPTCAATRKISEDLVAFHVYSFSSFLFSSLVALGLKQAIRISSGSSRFPRTFHLSSDLTFDLAWVNKNLLRVGYLVSAAGSVSGCVFLMLALINVVQIKLGTLGCGSAHTYGAVVPLVILVPSALLIYVCSVLYAFTRKSSLDAEVFKLASCGPAIMDEKATPSNGCFLRVKKLCHNPSCPSAVMLSNTAKSARIKPEIAMTIPKHCDIADRPVGYKCGENGLTQLILMALDNPGVRSAFSRDSIYGYPISYGVAIPKTFTNRSRRLT
ncbi:hypothetical protein RHGRI_007956 [Rhododendron griersonianum]|uniref:Uncharacterized protein n=1 Tax=Rhododendron griersonianum TaxID=479676 RepID=A0AAV6KYW0_9ERIC|nr:hypothetical protein RHGRI_007956 [Rhododendron griersonianum]